MASFFNFRSGSTRRASVEAPVLQNYDQKQLQYQSKAASRTEKKYYPKNNSRQQQVQGGFANGKQNYQRQQKFQPLRKNVDYNRYGEVVHNGEDAKDPRILTDDLQWDPAVKVAPRSKKMALGSITYSSEQSREYGVFRKDNSFYLRCEKCDPAFCDRLSDGVERVNGLTNRIPQNELNFDYWPDDALNNYCHREDKSLRREMNAVYRDWHDGRSGMDQLYERLCIAKQEKDGKRRR